MEVSVEFTHTVSETLKLVNHLLGLEVKMSVHYVQCYGTFLLNNKTFCQTNSFEFKLNNVRYIPLFLS